MTKNLHRVPWRPSGRPPEYPKEDAGDVRMGKHGAVAKWPQPVAGTGATDGPGIFAAPAAPCD